MDSPTVSGLRSRSRSKTPFLRSSCDHETCTETEDHTHKSGRKTPIRRSTPIKQLGQTVITTETITETIEEEYKSPPAHRTRRSTRNADFWTSDYSSEEGTDQLIGQKEIFQNEINSQYERVSSSQQHSGFADVTFSPIQGSLNVTQDRSRRFGSPTTSVCSTDSSFAEQALADTSALLNVNPSNEHLPSRLYKLAGEYWNKYPKTDYTYSPFSKDRVELAPGLVAMPNMSRRSLSQFRVQGPNVSADEVDLQTTWSTSKLRKRYTYVDSSEDEGAYHNGAGYQPDERWWITRLLITIITTITTSTRNAYRSVVGPSHRYPYTERRPPKASILSRTAAVAAAPFYWIYAAVSKVVTATVTTVTEAITPNHVAQTQTYVGQEARGKRRWWPWLLLLLLPALGYGSHYTYENWEHFAVPNFTDIQLDLKEFKNKIPFPNITFADLNFLPKINLTMPAINITLPELPDLRQNMPEVRQVRQTYHEYKGIVQNRVVEASDYIKVVAESCYEEIWRLFSNIV